MPKMDDCINRFDRSKCDPWIIEKFETIREIKQPHDKDITDYIIPRDCPGRIDVICNNCKSFET